MHRRHQVQCVVETDVVVEALIFDQSWASVFHGEVSVVEAPELADAIDLERRALFAAALE